MQNSERFMAAYKGIETHLKHLLKTDNYVTFKELVDRASYKSVIVSHKSSVLRMCGDLRNAIVHEKQYNGHPIAEPCPEVVEELEEIHTRLVSPPPVEKKFLRHVETVSIEGSVADTLRIMNKNSFSQIPITDGNVVVGVMSSNTIARWLGKEILNDVFSLQETTNRTVMECAETKDNYEFFSRKKTYADALGSFDRATQQGKSLDAILITENGKSTEKLLGIITRFDVPELLSGLGIG